MDPFSWLNWIVNGSVQAAEEREAWGGGRLAGSSGWSSVNAQLLYHMSIFCNLVVTLFAGS